jgi:hypothetical protein
MPCTIHLVDVDAVVDLLGSPMLGCIVLWCWWCLPCTYELPQILAGDAATADELGVVYIDGHDLFLAGFGGGCWCCLLACWASVGTLITSELVQNFISTIESSAAGQS